MKRVKFAIVIVALFAAAALMEIGAVRARPTQAQPKRVSSFYALAGEFRTVAANLMWIKADQYHHEFVEKNPDWTKDRDLLGLLHIITDLDPAFVTAYSSGAMIHAYGSNDPKRALAYLNEGIAANPKAWELHRIAAIILARRLGNPSGALPYARAAVRYCDSDYDKRVVGRLLKTLQRASTEQTAKGRS
jgi:hypothetical protein